MVDENAAREVMLLLIPILQKWCGVDENPTPDSCMALLDTLFWLDDSLRTKKDHVMSLVQQLGEKTKKKFYSVFKNERENLVNEFWTDLKALEQVLFPETIVAADEDERRRKKGAALRKRCGFELLPPPPPVVVDLTATESAAASASQKPDPADSSSDYSTDPDADDLSDFEQEDIHLWKEAIRSLSQKKAKHLADLKNDPKAFSWRLKVLTLDIKDLNELPGDWEKMKKSLRRLRKEDQGFVQEIYLESEKIRETRSGSAAGSAAGSKHGTKRKR